MLYSCEVGQVAGESYEASDRYFIVAVLEHDPATVGKAVRALREARVVSVNFATVGELSMACDHARPRVVVLDLIRPDEEDIDVVRLLRAHDAGGHMSIVAVGEAHEGELPMDLCELLDCYIRKPANWTTVSRVVVNLANGRRPPSTGARLLGRA